MSHQFKLIKGREELNQDLEILYRESIDDGLIAIVKRAPEGKVDLEVYENGRYIEQLHMKNETLDDAKASIFGLKVGLIAGRAARQMKESDNGGAA